MLTSFLWNAVIWTLTSVAISRKGFTPSITSTSFFSDLNQRYRWYSSGPFSTRYAFVIYLDNSVWSVSSPYLIIEAVLVKMLRPPIKNTWHALTVFLSAAMSCLRMPVMMRNKDLEKKRQRAQRWEDLGQNTQKKNTHTHTHSENQVDILWHLRKGTKHVVEETFLD